MTTQFWRRAGSRSPEDIIRASGVDGRGGRCGSAAIAINHAVFSGEGTYVAGANVALLELGERLVGHVAVLVGGKLYDDSGVTTEESLESWGMLDDMDPDYIEVLQDVLGREPAEEDFSEAGIYDFTEDELYDLGVADHGVVDDFKNRLAQAMRK